MKLLFYSLILACVLSAIAMGAERKVWNFDRDRVGSAPPSFVAGEGTWQVTRDDSAPSKPNVLAQLAKNPDSAFNIILVGGSQWQDLELSVRMKPIAGRSDQGGGLVWRARDMHNYYVARYNPLEDNFRLYKVVNGHRSQLAGKEHIPGQVGWHTVSVSMKGTHIRCSLDNGNVIEHDDKTFTGAGRIGLWSKSDAQSHFDDLTVTALR